MMLHRHFEALKAALAESENKKTKEAVGKPANTAEQTTEAKTEEPVRRGRKRKAEE